MNHEHRQIPPDLVVDIQETYEKLADVLDNVEIFVGLIAVNKLYAVLSRLAGMDLEAFKTARDMAVLDYEKEMLGEHGNTELPR